MDSIRILAIHLVAIVLLSCSSTNQLNAKRKPDWVKQRPADNSYYMGRAMTPKIGGDVTYRTNARNKALKEMSSEIQVTISSNSILRQFENNYEVKEEFESSTSQSVEATLEGYEVLTWEDKKEYWVLVRLSKDKYAMQKEMKLDYAKKMSATYYYDAQKAVSGGNIYQALLLYVQAIKAIQPHVNEDLTYKDIEGTINLGSAIFAGVQDAFKAVHLQADQPNYKLQFSKELKVPLSLHASYVDAMGDKRALSNLPLKFYFSKGEGELSSPEATNREGVAGCDITRLISKRKSQEITAKFNVAPLFEKENAETRVLLKAFFHDEFLPTTIFNIEVQKSSAYLVIDEKSFGNSASANVFSKMIKSELASSYFNITTDEENADFIVKINSSFTKGDEKKGSGYSLYIVFADVNISIVDNKTQMEIFSDGFSGVKGIQPGSFEYALKDAREKAIEKLKDETLLDMEQVNL
ncbi:LPP20 family lipoprotein [Saccharicrinis aurantiacus]|uniref:LPP20 family lipoprotein n=1 Tax=Saccharicrinis aurantiacus TaxID=1849719 RepID=UPI0009FA1EC5|nr:LPP20 family lipoprotein [Saccharicrinis aurantiacus]